MKKLNMEAAQDIALNALKQYPRANQKVLDSFMKTDEWAAGGKGVVYEFTLYDMTHSKEFKATAHHQQPTGWEKPPEILLTIYVDRTTGETFVRRHVDKYPWEIAA